jgi:metal-responsive CopG/Arc/MetJ family transcriptional regulator
LLKFSTIEEAMMATVNFSVPDDVKDAFNEAYKGQNKSAVIAELMREAIERAQRKQRSHEAITRIMERRKHAPAMSNEELQAAREDGRP